MDRTTRAKQLRQVYDAVIDTIIPKTRGPIINNSLYEQDPRFDKLGEEGRRRTPETVFETEAGPINLDHTIKAVNAAIALNTLIELEKDGLLSDLENSDGLNGPPWFNEAKARKYYKRI